MDTCVVDNMPERMAPPSKQSIEEARQKQLRTLQNLRRLLSQAAPPIRCVAAV